MAGVRWPSWRRGLLARPSLSRGSSATVGSLHRAHQIEAPRPARPVTLRRGDSILSLGQYQQAGSNGMRVCVCGGPCSLGQDLDTGTRGHCQARSGVLGLGQAPLLETCIQTGALLGVVGVGMVGVWVWGSGCGLSTQHAGTLCMGLPHEAGQGATLWWCHTRTGSPTSKESWFLEGRAGEG